MALRFWSDLGRSWLSWVQLRYSKINILVLTFQEVGAWQKLAIVVGHSEKREGAQATAPIRQREYTWNLDLADKMMGAAQPIPEFEAKVFLRNHGLIAAYQDAINWGADAAIELHFNAAGDRSAHGTETLYYTDVSYNFAKQLHSATLRALDLRNRGIKKPAKAGQRGEQNLKQMGHRPSILLEPFFGSNKSDARIAHRKKTALARAQIRAAADYLLTPFDNNDDRFWIVTANALNVRGGPGTAFETQSWGPLKRGDEVKLITRYDSWYFIQFGDDEANRGFVHGSFLK